MTQHHRNGSTYPDLARDVLRVYSMKYCPFAERTRLVLEHKKIPYETVNVNLWDKPDWFLARTPVGLVPVLEKNDKIVFDSTICNYYLDEIYPQNRIVPDDPFEKAQVSMLLEQCSKYMPSFFATMNPAKADEREQNYAKFLEGLKVLENALTKPFFGGAQPGFVDFSVWPFFERMGALDAMVQKQTVTEGNFPKLSKWMQAMFNTEAVKAVQLSTDIHSKFIQSFFKGKPEYDSMES